MKSKTWKEIGNWMLCFIYVYSLIVFPIAIMFWWIGFRYYLSIAFAGTALAIIAYQLIHKETFYQKLKRDEFII